MIPPGAALTGLRAALAAPRWIASARLGELLELAPPQAVPADATAALRVCRVALRLLARLQPLGCPWRDSMAFPPS
jgi:hypothetical protein